LKDKQALSPLRAELTQISRHQSVLQQAQASLQLARAGVANSRGSLAMSLRSRRQHKAWGVSPRSKPNQTSEACEAGDSVLPCFTVRKDRRLSPVSRSYSLSGFPGAHAQALRWRLLRRLDAGPKVSKSSPNA